jgi:hypothetical protein
MAYSGTCEPSPDKTCLPEGKNGVKDFPYGNRCHFYYAVIMFAWRFLDHPVLATALVVQSRENLLLLLETCPWHLLVPRILIRQKKTEEPCTFGQIGQARDATGVHPRGTCASYANRRIRQEADEKT